MSNNLEEYTTRDDSEINENYNSSDSEEYVENYINNGLGTRRNKNRKWCRTLSTSSEEEDPHLTQNIENCKRTEMFLWTKKNLTPILHIFDDGNSGVKVHLNAQSTPFDAFQIFFSEELVSQITEQTNNYFKYVKDHIACKTNSRLNNWQNASVCEMYGFFCTTMLMSRVRKLSLREYWSTDEMLKTSIFRKIIARDRYMLLLQMLNFNDHNVINDDPIIKIRPVVDKLKKSFSQSFTPYENLCIDESLVPYKGRCYFKQFIPSKRSRFGIKIFVLCDCRTNYVLDFIIYTGKKTEISQSTSTIGISGNVVMTLLQPYFEKGHTLITDNWYTSPRLYTLLHEHKTNAFGTVRKNRSEMPRMEESLKKGEICYRSTNNLLAMKWRDKKDVWMLSTVHAARLIETEKRNYRTGLKKTKPSCIADYNSYMGAVDKVDMVLSTLNSTRKTIKWYKKLFFRLLDLAIYNAYILYKNSTGTKQKFNEFHSALVKDTLRKYPQSRSVVGGGKKDSKDIPFRLTERHFLSKCSNQTDKAQLARRKCVVCAKHKKRSDTRYECRKCDVGLCIDCFETYHTQMNF
ncbi:piggyBac transposable element-derived protein 4-like [Bombus vosnesenskii]|uniref:PiggyBac transposable element-derived protein 4-like n=1 Tax=Bombus vosnesenskii TaxID=207650 RepID=A0A6J3L667_9HYME|nr:piggyBac transposable element-derived protein 4-like [Bombus vosnesenskii]